MRSRANVSGRNDTDAGGLLAARVFEASGGARPGGEAHVARACAISSSVVHARMVLQLSTLRCWVVLVRTVRPLEGM